MRFLSSEKDFVSDWPKHFTGYLGSATPSFIFLVNYLVVFVSKTRNINIASGLIALSTEGHFKNLNVLLWAMSSFNTKLMYRHIHRHLITAAVHREGKSKGTFTKVSVPLQKQLQTFLL